MSRPPRSWSKPVSRPSHPPSPRNRRGPPELRRPCRRGITPSLGMLTRVRERTALPTHADTPRGGDFLFDGDESEVMFGTSRPPRRPERGRGDRGARPGPHRPRLTRRLAEAARHDGDLPSSLRPHPRPRRSPGYPDRTRRRATADLRAGAERARGAATIAALVRQAEGR